MVIIKTESHVKAWDREIPITDPELQLTIIPLDTHDVLVNTSASKSAGSLVFQFFFVQILDFIKTTAVVTWLV